MSSLTGIFSDIFARQENAFTRVDPRPKLLIAFALLLAVLLSKTPVFPLCTLLLCVGMTRVAGVPFRLIGLRLAASLGIAAVIFALHAIMEGTTPLATFHLFSWKLVISKEGMIAGTKITSRVLGAVSVVLLLSSITPAHRIFCALRAMGLPQSWVEIALLIYRYIFVALDVAVDLTAAQKVRLGYATATRGVASAGLVAGAVVIRSMDQAIRTSEAMRTRGCGENIPIGPLPRLAPASWFLTAIAVLLVGGAYFLLEILLVPARL